MMRSSLIALLCVPIALGGCADVRKWVGRDSASKMATNPSPEDHDLRIAAEVVRMRLRQVDASGDWQELRPLKPQIYELATALMPNAKVAEAHTSASDAAEPVPAAMPASAPLQPGIALVNANALSNSYMEQAVVARGPVHSQPLPDQAAPMPTAQKANPAGVIPPDAATIPNNIAPAAPPAPELHVASQKPEAVPHQPAPQVISASASAAMPDSFAPPPMMESSSRSLFHAVQLGSYRSEGRALQGWQQLQNRAQSSLAQLSVRTERVDLGAKGIYFRLKAGPFDTPEQAASRCRELMGQGISCLSTDFTGTPPRPNTVPAAEQG